MRRLASLIVLSILLAVVPAAGAAAEAPAGQVTWAAHITLAPTWFDPAETPGIGTPFMILYALHDALVKPMPGNPMAPSLAESWSLSKDGLVYEFVLRQGAFFKAYQEKKLKNLAYSISGAFGNAATRLEVFTVGGGPYVYGSYPDIDGLFREQAGELDRKRREATLHRIQQLMFEKAMYAPVWELGFIHAHGPRVAESGLGLITGWAFSAPYEDVRLKGK